MVEETAHQHQAPLDVGDQAVPVADALDVTEGPGTDLGANPEPQPLDEAQVRRETRALGVEDRLEPVLDPDAVVRGRDEVGVVVRHAVQVAVRGGGEILPGAALGTVEEVGHDRTRLVQAIGKGGPPERCAPDDEGLDLGDGLARGPQPDPQQRLVAAIRTALGDHAPARHLARRLVGHAYRPVVRRTGRRRPQACSDG